MTDLPSQAKIVIIGGGAVGCSIAYHLARAGARDVLLLEKAQLTHGSTWHAAGLVGQLRSKKNLTRLMQNSVAVYDRLEAESGQAIDWKKAGSLRIAASGERLAEIRRSLTQAKGFGFEAHEISPKEAQDRFPWMTLDGVVGAAWIPSDGYIDPYALTQAYAKVARAGGVTIREGVTVTGFERAGRRITGVETNHGTIACETIVNASGIWAKRVGEMAGVALAAGAVEHQYVVTEKKIDVTAATPTFRDPDRIFYLKPDVGSFAIGGWEQGAPACWPEGVPFEFGRELFSENYDRLERFMLPAAERLPILNEVGIQTVINGPIPVSADGEPVMGLAPELDNFYVACGFTAGIAASGGAGEAMANWILHGDPGMDLWPFDVRRFSSHQANRTYLAERSSESYGHYYSIHWPGDELQSARGGRLSPLYDILKKNGAVYGSKAGWERPLWFDTGEVEASETPSFEQKPGWFSAVGREHVRVREAVALIDQTSFSKFEVTGPGAFEALQGLAANDLAKPDGSCIYTQLCNGRGGIEADLTIMRLDADRYYVVTGSQFGVRDAGWIARHLPDDGSVQLRDVTSAFAVINLVGPKAREVLQSVTYDDVSNEAFPYLAVRDIEIGLARVRAARVGYVGELGWELHVPAEQAVHVYRTLREAGEAHGIADIGYRAIESLRLEKGFVYWSAEVTPDTDPYEAGLGFCVALDKGDFIGRDALGRIRADGPARRLVTLSVDGYAPLIGGEAVLHEGRVVGTTTSAGFGYTVGRTIAFAYVPAALSKARDFVIEAYGKAYVAQRGSRALYDPKGERLRG
ncbi:FAD-dependent oxidoreductase [Microbaculum marinum]|uniref:FAD-dependent oxidoreductase n=1 Tax=Microbaculum marinum TaxID=1764581 RepID=A0AAW9RVB1_9HYPH